MNNNFIPLLNYRFFLILSGLCFCLSTFGFSQKTAPISIIYLNEAPSFKLNTKRLHSPSMEECKHQIKTSYLNKGYLEISIDSTATLENVFTFYIYTGKRYKLKHIQVNPEKFKSISKYLFIKQTLNPQLIQKLDSQVLTQVINLGYPYAQLTKEFEINKKHTLLNYTVNSNHRVKFDSIKTSPPNLVSHNYLSKLTGIEAGKPYSEKAINILQKRINQSQLFLFDTSYVSHSQNKSHVVVKLKKINQNSFSGLVGIQSNDKNETEVTGKVSIALANAFKKGEQIQLEWKKSGNESQQLQTKLALPYIFKLPVGVSLYANLDKQDSSFTNTQFKFTLLLPSKYYGDLSVNAKWLNSNINSTVLPNFNSNSSTLYGLGYQYSIFDNPIFPKKGILIQLETYLGNNKLINSNGNSNNTIFETLGNFTFAFPLPIGSIYTNTSGALMINDSIKTNNLYRIGGANSIRGFNENSIYAKSYVFNNLEYRLYLNSESFIYSIYDLGFFNEPDSNSFTYIFRQAIGMGLSIKTKGGNLKVSYAIGKSGTNAFQLNQGKIHLGYINHF